MLTLRFQLSRSEFFSTYRRVCMGRWCNWAIAEIGFAIGILGIYWADPVLITLGVVYIVGWSAYAWVLAPRMMWRRHAQLRAEQVVSVSEDGVTTELVNARTTADWTFWTDVSVAGDAYVLRAKHRGYCFIPRRAFESSDAEQLFRELAHRRTGATLG